MEANGQVWVREEGGGTRGAGREKREIVGRARRQKCKRGEGERERGSKKKEKEERLRSLVR